MKGQDIVLLLKLAAMRKRDVAAGLPADAIPRYSVRGLAQTTGISKSEVGLSLQRCFAAGLAHRDPRTDVPLANLSALREFLAHGLRYVFPVMPGASQWGVPTAWSVKGIGLMQKDARQAWVWPAAEGKTRGLAIEPLFRSVPGACAQDADLHALLSAADALRLSGPADLEQSRSVLLELLEP